MFVLALSLYNTWNRGVFLLCKITNLLIYSIIFKNPPKTLVYAPFCRSLPTLFLPFRLLILSQNKQNRARRGKLKSSNVVEIRVGYHCCFLPYTANFYSDKLYFCSLILKASFPPSRISQTCSRIPY